MDVNELWTTIHRYGGLGSLWRAVGEINEEAERRHLSDPGTEDLRTRIRWMGRQIRFFIVCCGVENRWYGRQPDFPRITAWMVAKLYCEMMSTLQAMPSPQENLVVSSNNRH